MRLALIAWLVFAAVPAAAQNRPFLFSITPASDAETAARIDYDLGVGERTFQSDIANQPEQRIGVQASFRRVTLIARLGIAESGSAYQSSQSAELLYSLPGALRGIALAGGGGVLHEPGGVNVLLGRVTAGRDAASWLLHGNALFQKPLSAERDPVDLITSVGWARRLSPGVSLGAEAIGEDLEGFWEAEETEGGARLLLGPSLHIAPPRQHWQLIATGGPLFHPQDTDRSSGAFRDLPAATKRAGYAFKMALSVSLTGAR